LPEQDDKNQCNVDNSDNATVWPGSLQHGTKALHVQMWQENSQQTKIMKKWFKSKTIFTQAIHLNLLKVVYILVSRATYIVPCTLNRPSTQQNLSMLY